MKIIKQAIIGAVALSFASAVHVFAIEGLQVSVQCSNVMLSWPSTEGETYIVQYRQTLNQTDSWATVTDYFPAAIGTNITFFVHSNVVQHPNCGGNGFFSAMAANRSMAISAPSLPAVPMAIPRDGSSVGVPACLYPPGMDMSGFDIIDPVSGESVNGSLFTTARALASSDPLFDGPQPLGGGGSGSSMPEPETGFYQVVRDGVHICGLTNGMVLSGLVQQSIEFAVGSTDQIVGVTFYDENNSPIIGASAQGAGNLWTLDWNTPMLFNGNYNIYAELDFASDTPVVGAPVTVTVNNTISFPNYFSRVFGDQMWIYAETVPNASYRIDMYGQSTNYLGYFYGTADGNGTISFLWGLSGLTDATFLGVFTVDTSSLSSLSKAQVKSLNANAPGFQTLSLVKKALGNTVNGNGIQPAGAGSSSSANQLWVKEPVWTPNNNWVIAYASLTGDARVDQSATDMILGGPGEDTDWYGVIGTLDKYGLNGNLSPGNNGQAGTVFTLNDTNSRSQLLSYLADHRYENFYFFGHGNSSVISAYNAPVTTLTMQQIAAALVNVPLSYSILHAAEHPYRFVFIDACDTGKANFCEAFGVPAFTVSTNFFAAAGVESRAFIGFTKPTGFDPSLSSGDPNGVPNRSIATAYFIQAWLGGAMDLNHIVGAAQNGFGQDIYKMSSSAVIYGAYDLTRNIRTRP